MIFFPTVCVYCSRRVRRATGVALEYPLGPSALHGLRRASDDALGVTAHAGCWLYYHSTKFTKELAFLQGVDAVYNYVLNAR